MVKKMYRKENSTCAAAAKNAEKKPPPNLLPPQEPPQEPPQCNQYKRSDVTYRISFRFRVHQRRAGYLFSSMSKFDRCASINVLPLGTSPLALEKLDEACFGIKSISLATCSKILMSM